VSSRWTNKARDKFAEIMSRKDEEINLAEAALLIATEEYPRLDVSLYLEKLDMIGDIARERANAATDAYGLISALNDTLFDEIGFKGNRQSYYDPRNSFLNEVIDRRVGIPITLTIIYMEIARRIGLRIEGVGLPGHFIAKHPAEIGDIFIDPFNGGRLIGELGCAEILSEMSHGKLKLKPEHLLSVTNKQILARMLGNLLGIYSSSDYPRAMAIVEFLLIIFPDAGNYIRDRGLLLAATGDSTRGIRELERYLLLEPDAPDRDAVREQIKTIRQNIAKLN
jgi:regulator of sirC expression with transglutaminase-like and TPR domain